MSRFICINNRVSIRYEYVDSQSAIAIENIIPLYDKSNKRAQFFQYLGILMHLNLLGALSIY